MRILVMNDDGINAPGIYALALAMSQIGEVTVVAPAEQQSAASHRINIADTLRVRKAHFGRPQWNSARIASDEPKFAVCKDLSGIKAYSVTGSPADCGKVAMFSIMKDNKPDLAVSGINAGNNAGVNALYSGTIGAAAEAALCGIPSMAVSLDVYHNADYSYSAEFALDFAKKLIAAPLPPGVIANINLPNLPKDKIKGAKITKMSMMRYNEWYETHTDSHGRHHYWLEGDYEEHKAEPGTDLAALEDGYVSITPIHFDLTANSAFETLSEYSL